MQWIESLKSKHQLFIGLLGVGLLILICGFLLKSVLTQQWDVERYLNQISQIEVVDSTTGKVILKHHAGKDKTRHPVSEEKVFNLAQVDDKNNQPVATLNIGVADDQVAQQGVDSILVTTLIIILMGWGLAVLAVLGITRQFRNQLRLLMTSVWRMHAGDFGSSIPAEQLHGELNQLAILLNEMSAKLRNYEDQNIERLTLERNKLECVLLSIAEGVLVCDNDGTLVIINQAACEMLQLIGSERVLGQKIGQYVSDEGEKPFESVIQDYQEDLPNHSGRIPFGRSVVVSGRSFNVMISPIYDKDNQSLGFVMIVRDITREIEVDRLKTQFISNVSHELRTPVTTIKSYVDTLFHHGSELDETTYNEFLATINVETDRLKRMVNDILDFSRLESPEVKIEMDYHDIAPIINLTIQSIRVLAEQKQLTISTAIESNLPKAYMNADSMERILRNLLSNAIKYTPENGRIRVKTELVSNGDEIMVQVEDNGVGIPEEHLTRIWDRFYRVENEVHTIKGTGLGLHLVKIAIEQHHKGRVFAYSQVGQGSTIGFVLPINPPLPTEAKTNPLFNENQGLASV